LRIILAMVIQKMGNATITIRTINKISSAISIL
jgi:hypothetical protein